MKKKKLNKKLNKKIKDLEYKIHALEVQMIKILLEKDEEEKA